jgi:hypothetical protein
MLRSFGVLRTLRDDIHLNLLSVAVAAAVPEF